MNSMTPNTSGPTPSVSGKSSPEQRHDKSVTSTDTASTPCSSVSPDILSPPSPCPDGLSSAPLGQHDGEPARKAKTLHLVELEEQERAAWRLDFQNKSYDEIKGAREEFSYVVAEDVPTWQQMRAKRRKEEEGYVDEDMMWEAYFDYIDVTWKLELVEEELWRTKHTVAKYETAKAKPEPSVQANGTNNSSACDIPNFFPSVSPTINPDVAQKTQSQRKAQKTRSEPKAGTYRHASAQTNPVPDNETFQRCYGRNQTSREANLVMFERFRRNHADMYSGHKGKAFRPPTRDPLVGTTDSGFQTKDFHEKEVSLRQAKAKAGIVAARLKRIAGEKDIRVFAEQRDKIVAHSQQYALNVSIDADGTGDYQQLGVPMLPNIVWEEVPHSPKPRVEDKTPHAPERQQDRPIKILGYYPATSRKGDHFYEHGNARAIEGMQSDGAHAEDLRDFVVPVTFKDSPDPKPRPPSTLPHLKEQDPETPVIGTNTAKKRKAIEEPAVEVPDPGKSSLISSQSASVATSQRSSKRSRMDSTCSPPEANPSRLKEQNLTTPTISTTTAKKRKAVEEPTVEVLEPTKCLTSAQSVSAATSQRRIKRSRMDSTGSSKPKESKSSEESVSLAKINPETTSVNAQPKGSIRSVATTESTLTVKIPTSGPRFTANNPRFGPKKSVPNKGQTSNANDEKTDLPTPTAPKKKQTQNKGVAEGPEVKNLTAAPTSKQAAHTPDRYAHEDIFAAAVDTNDNGSGSKKRSRDNVAREGELQIQGAAAPQIPRGSRKFAKARSYVPPHQRTSDYYDQKKCFQYETFHSFSNVKKDGDEQKQGAKRSRRS